MKMKVVTVTVLALALALTALTGAEAKPKLKKQKAVYYVHVWIGEKNNTETKVAGVNGTASSGLAFGTVTVMDGTVTVGADPNSKYVGKCQGAYINAAVDGSNYQVMLSLIFKDGSTLDIFGSNRVNLAVRSVSVVGGTGLFRFATGTVDILTVVIDPTSHYTLKFSVNYSLPR